MRDNHRVLVPLLLVVLVLALVCVLMTVLRRRVLSGSSSPASRWQEWGVRTVATTRSPEAWDAAHRAILPMITATGALAGVGTAAAMVVAVTRGVTAGLVVGLAASAVVLVMAGSAAVRADIVARRTESVRSVA